MKSIAKFSIAMIAMMIICAIIWHFVASDLYDCTELGVLPDFWDPGWVHTYPVVSVKQIVHGRSGGSDTILEGWSVARLWALWCSFTFVSLVVSTIFARTRWVPNQQKKNIG